MLTLERLLTRGYLFRDGEPVTVVDVIDRRYRYEIVWHEESESLGCLFRDGDGRLRCACESGRQVYEDRLDGSRPWVADGCVHELALLAYNLRTTLAGERAGRRGDERFDPSVFVDAP